MFTYDPEESINENIGRALSLGTDTDDETSIANLVELATKVSDTLVEDVECLQDMLNEARAEQTELLYRALRLAEQLISKLTS